jgi:hypothetical protein
MARDRVELGPGDIFNDDLGRGRDLMLAVHIYHGFSIGKNLELSRRQYAAAKRGAFVMVVDLLPDQAHAKDSIALTFAPTIVLWMQQCDGYPRSEYGQMPEPPGLGNLDQRGEVAPPRPAPAIVARK